jgi:hypothetical protein
MVQINNKELIKGIADNANIQIAKNPIPDQLADKVVPVMETNPLLLRRIKAFSTLGSLSNATSATLYTCSSIKDTYITNVSLSMIKDATSTSTEISIQVVNEDGTTAYIFRFAGITLTADTQAATVNFAYPLKLKRGSNITINSDTNVANIRARGTVLGYEVDSQTN